VLKIHITQLVPAAARLNGATVGEAHAQQLQQLIAAAPSSDGGIVVLDFSGVESASASYLKRVRGS
jgi:anti-anti-sigma regulatory factor